MSSNGVSLRVLLDVAELGPWSYTGHGGVRRVVENITQRLVLQPQLAVEFTGVGPVIAREVSCSLGIEDKKSHSRSTAALQQAATSARRLKCAFDRRHPALQMVGRAFSAAALLERRLAESIPTAALLDGQVIHSFYRAFPWNVQRYRAIAKVITIYDLIPLLQPQLASPHFAVALHKILKSITSETWVLCISEWVKGEFCEYTGHPVDRVIVMPLAASATLFYPWTEGEWSAVQSRYNLPDGPYILSLGALDQRKNIRHLINAFRRLVQSGDARHLHLVLAGSEAGAATLHRSLSVEDPVRTKLVFTGTVADGDLAAIYSNALAFAFPSLAEGFGLPVLEAMQCGTPVISSDTSALPEVVGSAGLLLDPKDEDAWAAAILSVVNDETLRLRLGEAAFVRAASFTWDRTVDIVLDAYQQATGAL